MLLIILFYVIKMIRMPKQNQIQNIIFKDKQAKIILTLRTPGQDWYISSLAKTTNTTYVHTCNFIAFCESIGLTTSEKHGKIKVIRLTDKGAQIADMIAGIYSVIATMQKTVPIIQEKQA
jgi:predicted transcriptional regulator